MQNLALDIAGRSMFSLETRQYGAAMRRLLTEYGLQLLEAASVRHGAAAVDPDVARSRPPAVPAPLDGADRRRSCSRASPHPPTDTPRDLFDLLLAARDPETGEGFSPDQLRDQIATMILAGHETTAVTLFWSLVLLSGAPDEQQRVAEEARGVEITPDNAMAAMPQLVRTRAVISEALRLYPPAFALAREAIGDGSRRRASTSRAARCC